MTIDERLEALTQSVELLASIHRDTERFVGERFSQLAESMDRLANIVAAHDERLDDHEDRLNDLGNQ